MNEISTYRVNIIALSLAFVFLCICGRSSSGACPPSSEFAESEVTEIGKALCFSGLARIERIEIWQANDASYGRISFGIIEVNRNEVVVMGMYITIGPYGDYKTKDTILLDREEVAQVGNFLSDAVEFSSKAPSSEDTSIALIYRSASGLNIICVQGKTGKIYIKAGDLLSDYRREVILSRDQVAGLRDALGAARSRLER